MLKKRIIPTALILLLAGLALTLSEKNKAPEVQFSALSGQQFNTAQLKGKVVLINFWATTCSGCIAEMPQLIETYQRQHPRGFEIIAVAMEYDPADQVRNYATRQKLPFPVVLDTDATLAKTFGDVRLTPTAILIDKQGNIMATTVGELDFAKLNQQLDQELGRAG